MPKDIPVSNGSFLLNFDSDYQIHDVYFPFIGQENHGSGHPFLFGVWVDGHYSWMGPEWQINLRYQNESLVTDVVLRHETLGLELHCADVVDLDVNIYVKKIEVINLRDTPRQTRLFFSHEFHLYGNDIGGTAYFDPRSCSIIHYKIQRYFLISCWAHDQWGVKHFACGRREPSGSLETIQDAENGELSGEASAWGSPHSTIGMWLELPAKGTTTAYYWIAAGMTYPEVAQLNLDVHHITPEELIKRSSKYWKTWVHKDRLQLEGLPQSVTEVFNRSLLIIRTQIDNRGAIIAANDSDIVRFGKDTYSYMWGRDGAFVAAALAQWIANQLQPVGSIHLDAGATDVIRSGGASLLPVGVSAVDGEFNRGDLIACIDQSGHEIARGLVNYNSAETRLILGKASSEIEAILGYIDEPELIHRDNLAML